MQDLKYKILACDILSGGKEFKELLKFLEDGWVIKRGDTVSSAIIYILEKG